MGAGLYDNISPGTLVAGPRRVWLKDGPDGLFCIADCTPLTPEAERWRRDYARSVAAKWQAEAAANDRPRLRALGWFRR